MALVKGLDLARGKVQLGEQPGMKPHHRGEGILKHTGYMKFVAPINDLTHIFNLKVAITDFLLSLSDREGIPKMCALERMVHQADPGGPLRPERFSLFRIVCWGQNCHQENPTTWVRVHPF